MHQERLDAFRLELEELERPEEQKKEREPVAKDACPERLELMATAKVDEFVAKDPFWKPFIEGIDYGGPEPLFTDYKGFQNSMIEMVQSVVTGKAEPEAALKKAAGEIEAFK